MPRMDHQRAAFYGIPLPEKTGSIILVIQLTSQGISKVPLT